MNTPLSFAADRFREEVEHEVNAVLLDTQDARLSESVDWLMLLVDDVADQMVEEAKFAGAHLRDSLHDRLAGMFPGLTQDDVADMAAQMRAPLVAIDHPVDVSARLAGHVPAEVGIPTAPSMARFITMWSDSMIPHQEITAEIASEIEAVQNHVTQAPVTRPHCKVHGGFARVDDLKCAKCDEQVSPVGDVQKILDALSLHFRGETALAEVKPAKKARKATQTTTKGQHLKFAVRGKGEVARRSLYAMSKLTGDPVVEIPVGPDGFAHYAETHGVILQEVPVSQL